MQEQRRDGIQEQREYGIGIFLLHQIEPSKKQKKIDWMEAQSGKSKNLAPAAGRSGHGVYQSQRRTPLRPRRPASLLPTLLPLRNHGCLPLALAADPGPAAARGRGSSQHGVGNVGVQTGG